MSYDRDAHLRYTYDISEARYDQMFEACGGVCEICGKEDARLVVDHCHSTSAIRGLLCSSCNLGLGQFADNPQVLRWAADYLEIHNGKKSS
jgi:hypothetical protein